MNIALVGGTIIDEVERLRATLLARGHAVDVIELSEMSVHALVGGRWSARLGTYDLVYYRNGFGETGRTLLSRALAAGPGVFINAGYQAHALCQDKVYQAAVAVEHGVPIPPTYIGRYTPFAALAAGIGLPFIAKAAKGTQGAQVFLVRSEAEYRQFLRDTVPHDVLFQRYVPNSGDYRVFVIGSSVYEVYKRIPAPGSFKANISLGGTGERVADADLRQRLSTMALSVTGAMGIDIAGVDIIESSDDGALYFLESNTNPGWNGLDAALGVDTAEHIADYFEMRVRTHASA